MSGGRFIQRDTFFIDRSQAREATRHGGVWFKVEVVADCIDTVEPSQKANKRPRGVGVSAFTGWVTPRANGWEGYSRCFGGGVGTPRDWALTHF